MGAQLKAFIPRSEINELIERMGREISKDYSTRLEPDQELIVVVTLKGALFFAADLVRHLRIPCRIDFVRVASYGAGTKSSGVVRILKDIENQPQNQHLLILDEIVDSGRTCDFLLKRLAAAGPQSVRICSLLSKPSRREVPVAIDYLGREVEDKFLVGYGLDFGEKYRNLPDICVLE